MSRAKEEAIKNNEVAIFTATVVLSMFLMLCIGKLWVIKNTYVKTKSDTVRVATREKEDMTYYYLVYSYLADSEIYACEGKEKLLKPSPKNEIIFYNKERPDDCSIGYKKHIISIILIVVSSIIYLGFVIIVYKNIKKLSKRRGSKKKYGK